MIPVTFSRRTEYARLVIKARLNESERQLSKMRSGLCSVIPEQLLGFMTWEELERRVCGSPEVDLTSLKRHTQYRQVLIFNRQVRSFLLIFYRRVRSFLLIFLSPGTKFPAHFFFYASTKVQILTPADLQTPPHAVPPCSGRSQTALLVQK